MYCLCILMLLGFTATSQEKYKLRPNFANASKDALMKNADSLFYFRSNISYNITLDHIKPYKDIQADKTMQPGYLEKQLKLIAANRSILWHTVMRHCITKIRVMLRRLKNITVRQRLI